jgi:hypothetical protein
MTRYKGRVSPAVIRRNFPHQVVVPAEAVGGYNIPSVDVFFAQIDHPKHALRLRKDDREFEIYCFNDPQHAASFSALFGGEVIR